MPRRSTIQSAGESFFLSNFYFSSEALSAAVVKDAFSSKNCSVDAACGPQQLLPLAQAAVTLTHVCWGWGGCLHGVEQRGVWALFCSIHWN